MFGWNRDDWKNWMGHRGVPGLLSNFQQTLGGMFGGGGGGSMEGGEPTNLAELLSMMNRQGGQQGGQGGGSYLGGQGFI
jgi:hypothetical protein